MPHRPDPFREFLRGLPGDIDAAREAGLPVVLTVDASLPVHSQRLMDTLGVEVRVTQSATRAFVENLIDYRHSVVQANKRADAGDETLEICGWCMCEVDVDPQPHQPGCQGIGKPRTSTGPVLADLTSSPPPRPHLTVGARFRDDGLDALERMDAGLPQQPDVDDEPDDEVVLEEREPEAREVFEPPLVADSAPAAVGSESRSPATDPEAASRSSNTTWSRTPKWTKETVVAAIVQWAEEHDGVPPTSTQWMKKIDGYPTSASVIDVFGRWTVAIEAAGFQPRSRGGQRGKTSDGTRPGGWTRETAIAAVQAFAAEHGHPPSHKYLAGNPALPSAPTATRLFGSLSDLIVAAGFDRPTKGTDYARRPDDIGAREAASQERGEAALPQAQPARSSDVDDTRALAERGSERLGPDSPRSAGVRDLTLLRTAAVDLVNAIVDLLEATG